MKDSLTSGTGWILRDSGGEISRGGKTHRHVSSAMMAEALAIREALLHAGSIGITSIWLRSDAQALLKAISTKRSPTELHGILSDIDTLSSSFSFCRFSFCSRVVNGLVADSIAKAQLCILNPPSGPF